MEPGKIYVDTRRFRLRSYIAIGVGILLVIATIIGLIVMMNKDADTPSEAAASPGPTLTPLALASDTPAPNQPPTETPSPAPTPTLEPYQHVVQSGETLFFIIQLYGYRDLSVVPDIVLLNGMSSQDQPLVAGYTLLIPRQTPTPGPTTASTEQAAVIVPVDTLDPGAPTQDVSGCNLENRCISPDGAYWIHIVQEGETLAGLAFQYDTRINDIQVANNLGSDIIYPNQQLQIPILITLTPTLTPTGGPDSTATPTPSLSAPTLLSPAKGAIIARGQPVVLQWVPDHALSGDAHYLVVIRNTASGEEFRATTRSNAYRVPSQLQPGLGASQNYEWWVVVINGSEITSPVISGQGTLWPFTWGG